MQLRAAILGETASRSEGGRASLSEVVHHVSTDRLPVACSFGLLCVFDAEPGDSGQDFDIAVHVQGPDGRTALLFRDEHRFLGDYLSDGIDGARYPIANFRVTFPTPGPYEFVVMLDNERVGSAPFHVILVS